MSPSSPTEESILDKLDKVAPASLNQFDAFPKLPSTYKTRSGGRGVLTILVAVVSFLLVVNDIAEFIWGWPTYGFGIDKNEKSFMNVNIDLVVNMPCRYLSVDLRDAVGDRLYLSDGFRRDGTLFDITQARSLQAHTSSLDARQAVAQSRSTRGFFDILFRRNKDKFRPTYNYKADGSACRLYGSMEVKKVTANLHITTAGHGYRSIEHVDHSKMNLSHVITDFSFGPYFPDMTQPLKNTFELTYDPFVAYQYYLSVVPTTYISPGTKPLHTNQYSVTHYKRVLEHSEGTPGIFFKFDLEPINMIIHQRTTTFVQFLIRVVGVVGGVWCCAGWAFRISAKAIDVVSGADKQAGIVAAEASGAQTRRKWGGGDLRSRPAAGLRQDSYNNTSSPYASYANSPNPGVYSPGASSVPNSAHPYGRQPYGFGMGSAAVAGSQSFAMQQQQGGLLPPTPNPASAGPYSPLSAGGFPSSPNPVGAGAGLRSTPASPFPFPLPNSPLAGPGFGFGPHSPAGVGQGPPPRKVSGKEDKKKD